MTAAMPRDTERDEVSTLLRWVARQGCPPPDLVLPALEGTLPEPLGARVRAHVERCEICTELAPALERACEAPTAEETERIDASVFAVASPRWRFNRSVYAAAAAVVVLAGGLYIAERIQRAPAPPVHAPAPRQAEAQPMVLALNAPAIELPPESLALRSDARHPYAAALERALEPFSLGDYRSAAERLEGVARQYPRRPHAEFYLGASWLILRKGDPIPSLERARELAPEGSSISSEATWYLAVALERSGQRAAAAVHLADLCGGGSPRAEQACDGLRALTTRRP